MNGGDAAAQERGDTMAVSGKYGKVDIPGLGEEEPVFILRAQDRLAVPAIEMYRALADSHGTAVANGIQLQIDTFLRWDGSRKLPD
jgi:hypothetical protein